MATNTLVSGNFDLTTLAGGSITAATLTGVAFAGKTNSLTGGDTITAGTRASLVTLVAQNGGGGWCTACALPVEHERAGRGALDEH